MSYALEYIEIDIDFCANSYGEYPCEAALGITGAIKCFNSLGTCQDRLNFINDPVTLRFSIASEHYPRSIEAIPNIIAVSFTPPVVSLGKDLGERASLTVAFKDHRHSDTGQGFDPYLSERSYDPFKQGTFWGKFRARQPFLRGRKLRRIQGYLGQTLEQMETRHYVIESFDGPKPDGSYRIMAKDVLKFADDDRSLAPFVSNGRLLDAITDTATSMTLTPNDVGLEYPVEGHVNVGGNEAVAYARPDPPDSDAILLLTFESPLGSAVTPIDESPVGRTMSVGGGSWNNATDSNDLPGFGAHGVPTAGAGYLLANGAADLALGTGDFTIDFWYRPPTGGLAAQRTFIDFRPNATNGLYPRLFHNNTGLLRYHQNSADRISGTTALVVNTWHHIALTRSGGTTRLFLNGVQEGSNYADANNYLVGASRPSISTSGNSLGTETTVTGNYDSVRIIKGRALWTGAFTPPDRPTGDVDVFSITRAQLGSPASEHDQSDRVQWVQPYIAEKVSDILYHLFTDYANVDPAYIDLDTWTTEVDSFLQRVYTTYLVEPTGVHSLINEIIEQSGLSIWWDDLAQKIRLRVIREIATNATTLGEGSTIEKSLTIEEQPNKRVSQVNHFFGVRNYCESLGEPNNYTSVAVNVDGESELDYGSPAIKTIFSRWIPKGGLQTAERANAIYIARFRDAPRRFNLKLQRGIDAIELGGGCQIGSFALQDETGALVLVPAQVTRLDPTQDVYGVTAEEVRFTGLATDDPNLHVVMIDYDALNVNLRELHDSIYPEITDVSGMLVRCIVETGFTVGANYTYTNPGTGIDPSASEPAFDVGDWPVGLLIEVIIKGRLQGAGGRGGVLTTVDQRAQPGSTALKTTVPIDLILEDGSEVWGGAGGGGAGRRIAEGFVVCSPGGGGAGTEPGEGVDPSTVGNIIIVQSFDGTDETGGASTNIGFSTVGGAGGVPGAAGGNGAGANGSQTGAAAGNAIDGVSLCTITDNGADRRGLEIN